MKYELKKLLFSRLLTGVLILAAAADIFLVIYRSRDLIPVREQYSSSYEELKEEISRETDEMNRIVVSGSESEMAIVPELQNKLQIQQEAVNRMEQASGYPQWIASYVAEMKSKVSSGLFGTEGSHIAELNKGIGVYERLTTVQPSPVFQGAAEVIFSWNFSSAVSVLTAVLAAMVLFYQDRHDGTIRLIRATVSFQRHLYRNKCIASVLFCASVFIVLRIAETAAACTVLGIPSVFQPVQSVYGFYTCPYHVSVLTFFLMTSAWSILFLAGAAMLAVFAFSRFSSIIRAGIFLSACTGISFLASLSTNIWIDTASLFTLSEGTVLLNRNFYLTAGNSAFSQTVSGIILLLLYIFLFYLGGRYFFRTVRTADTRKKRNLPHFRVPRTLPFIELKKLLIMNHGLVLLLLFAAIQGYRVYENRAYLPAYELTYRFYSSRLSGEKDEQKKLYLQEERKFFDDLRITDGNDPRLDLEPAFQKAEMRYENLPDDIPYVYESGYEALVSQTNISYLFISVFLGTVVCSLVGSCAAAMEYETSVHLLANTASGYGRLRKIRLMQSALFAVIAAVITFLPRFLYLAALYGMSQPAAPLCALPMFSFVPRIIPIAALPLLILVMVFLLYSAVFAAAWKIAERTGKLTVTAGATLVIFSLLILVMKLFCEILTV